MFRIIWARVVTIAEWVSTNKDTFFLSTTYCDSPVFLAGCNKCRVRRRSMCMFCSNQTSTVRRNLLARNMGSFIRRRKSKSSTPGTDLSRESPSLESNVTTLFFLCLGEYYLKTFPILIPGLASCAWYKPSTACLPRGVTAEDAYLWKKLRPIVLLPAVGKWRFFKI